MNIRVEVAYGLPDRQCLLQVEVPDDASPLDAIRCSGLLQRFPGIDLRTAAIGVFSHIIKDPDSYRLRPGDRVEIYRPLKVDPKEARIRRARGESRKG